MSLTYSLDDTIALVFGVTVANNPRSPTLGHFQTESHTGTGLDQVVLDMMIADNAVMLRFDPFDTSTYIANLYKQILHRDADAGGAAYWHSQADHGLSYQGLLVGIATSAEHVAQVWP